MEANNNETVLQPLTDGIKADTAQAHQTTKLSSSEQMATQSKLNRQSMPETYDEK